MSKHTERNITDKLISKDVMTENPDAIEFKKRMLEWPNPVEYVNNMYGCHPRDGNMEYFKEVFGK